MTTATCFRKNATAESWPIAKRGYGTSMLEMKKIPDERMKELAAIMGRMKTHLNARLEAIIKERKQQRNFTQPRYDDVYFEGVAYLDAIARGEIDG
jgi:hypothetical protein